MGSEMCIRDSLNMRQAQQNSTGECIEMFHGARHGYDRLLAVLKCGFLTPGENQAGGGLPGIFGGPKWKAGEYSPPMEIDGKPFQFMFRFKTYHWGTHSRTQSGEPAVIKMKYPTMVQLVALLFRSCQCHAKDMPKTTEGH